MDAWDIGVWLWGGGCGAVFVGGSVGFDGLRVGTGGRAGWIVVEYM